MKFMGDYMAKGKTEIDVVHYLVTVGQKHEELRDEIYCHLIKQTTNNKSERAESCARGWRLLVILTAFLKPSATFSPYLRCYLQGTAFDKTREFQDQGIICLRNLKTVLKVGGRRILPEPSELSAVLDGKYTKIQKLYLPGDRTKSIKINAVTVVADVVRQMCEKMDVTAGNEYGVYITTPSSKHGTLLRPTDYILDTTTILERRNIPLRLYFKKILWFTDVKFDNALYVSIIFDQLLPDFTNGNLLVMKEMTPDFLKDTLATLLCMRHIALFPQPTVDELLVKYRSFVPPDVYKLLTESEWAAALYEKYTTLPPNLSPHDAKQRYLETISKFANFGARFFELDSVSDSRIKGPTLLMINKKGIAFLNPTTRETLLSYSFNEIVSTRRLGSRATNKVRAGTHPRHSLSPLAILTLPPLALQHFVDLKLGNLMLQRVTRCETRQGMEITSIISTYISSFVDEKAKSKPY